MNRRGFLSSLAAAALGVCMDVLPKFGLSPAVPVLAAATEQHWTTIMIGHANLVMVEPWRVGTLRGIRDQFVPGTLRLM